jgi:hypothetical protein
LANLILFSFAIYHYAVGVPAILSVRYTRIIAKKLYNLELPEKLDPRYEYNLKPLGFYALTLATLCVLQALSENLNSKRDFIFVLAGLLILRASGRFLYRDLFLKAFGVNWPRSRLNFFFNLALAVFLFYVATDLINK